MKFHFLLTAVLVVAATVPVQARLSAQWDKESLRGVVQAPSDWVPYPNIVEREKWDALPEPLRAACIARGDDVVNRWTEITATDFLEFARSGQRAVFEQKYFSRRYELSELVLAECVEGKGRFLDAIINRVWAICEESSWALPAHMASQQAGVGLPDIAEPMLDVMAAETAGVLAWTHYLLGPHFDRVSPLIRRRIAAEVERRVLAPGREREDLWWMGFDGAVPNNWNTIVCSYWMSAALLLIDDDVQRAADVAKILRTQDNFIAGLPADGSCDEGPMYWIGSAGALFFSLDLIQQATNGRVDGFSIPVVREAGRFVYRVHIAGDQFVNLGDAHRRQKMPADLIFRYGKKIGDSKLTAFGAATAKEQKFYTEGMKGLLLPGMLPALFGATELLAAAGEAQFPLPRDVWLPELGLMVARSTDRSSEGFFVAVQAGHNGKRHNHNDTGNVVVYHDGQPVLIDLGSARYEARTFGPQRYDIWINQSGWHNVPTIGDVMQSAGQEFKATDVLYRADHDRAEISFELATAYPAEAKVNTWRRTVTLHRGSEIVIADAGELAKPQRVDFNFITPLAPDVSAGELTLRGEDGVDFRLRFDASLVEPHIEPVEVTDAWLRNSWGVKIWRVVLRTRSEITRGETVFHLSSASR
jgi:hypothetical protein